MTISVRRFGLLARPTTPVSRELERTEEYAHSFAA